MALFKVHNILDSKYLKNQKQLDYKISSGLRQKLSNAQESPIFVGLLYLSVFLVWMVVVLLVVVRL